MSFGWDRGRDHFRGTTYKFGARIRTSWHATVEPFRLRFKWSGKGWLNVVDSCWHHYVGTLIAPSVIFFALSGALQIYSFHESRDGYEAPALLQKLSAVHKDQVFALKSHDHSPDDNGPPAGPGIDPRPPPRANDHDESPSLGTRLLRWFFLFVALALTASTVLGLWMGLTHSVRNGTTGWLLLAGVLLPVAVYLV